MYNMFYYCDKTVKNQEGINLVKGGRSFIKNGIILKPINGVCYIHSNEANLPYRKLNSYI